MDAWYGACLPSLNVLSEGTIHASSRAEGVTEDVPNSQEVVLLFCTVESIELHNRRAL